jgi:hypothetical protein
VKILEVTPKPPPLPPLPPPYTPPSSGRAQTTNAANVREMANDLAQALDPAVFAKRCGFQPDPWQADVLRSNAQRILLNCSRQSGKSTMTALLALHTAKYQPGSLTLLLSPSQRQSQELFRKVLDAYHTIAADVPADAETLLRLELSNLSRIVALPGKEQTVRGYSGVKLLVIDEAARVPNDLYLSVRPMLAVSQGRLIALSTPFGTRGFFYEAWVSSDPWERYEVPASQCPRIPAEFLEEERRNLGEFWYASEYENIFLDAQSQAFRSEDIDAAFSNDLETWEL